MDLFWHWVQVSNTLIILAVVSEVQHPWSGTQAPRVEVVPPYHVGNSMEGLGACGASREPWPTEPALKAHRELQSLQSLGYVTVTCGSEDGFWSMDVYSQVDALGLECGSSGLRYRQVVCTCRAGIWNVGVFSRTAALGSWTHTRLESWWPKFFGGHSSGSFLVWQCNSVSLSRGSSGYLSGESVLSRQRGAAGLCHLLLLLTAPALLPCF